MYLNSTEDIEVYNGLTVNGNLTTSSILCSTSLEVSGTTLFKHTAQIKKGHSFAFLDSANIS